MTDEEKKSRTVKLAVQVAILLVLIGLCTWYEKVFEKETASEVIGAISNALFVPGAMFTGVGILSWAGYKGVFDGLKFAFGKYGLHNFIPGVHVYEQYGTYYDYINKRNEERKGWSKSILFMGLICIVIAIILSIIYMTM